MVDMFAHCRAPSVRQRSWNSRFANKPAFITTDVAGYKKGRLGKANYLAHQVIWAMHYGEWIPEVDHINRDRSDNRISNLRNGGNNINARNKSKQSNNTSGTTGVHWCRATEKWIARIYDNGIRVNLGSFNSLGDAKEARENAAKTLGYSEGHGR